MTVLTQQQPTQQWPLPHAAAHTPQPPASPQQQASSTSGVVFEFKNTDPSSMATTPAVTGTTGPSIGPTVCSNCKTTDTPLWRRDADGNSICNACGLYQKSRRMARPTALQRSPSSAPSAATTAVEPTPAPVHLGGTCPGDGRCDGTGGTSACSGCPTFNNALQAHAQHQQQQHNSPSPHPSSPSPPPITIASDEAKAPNANNQRGRVPISSLSCHNCNTSTTPLWRRDDAGNNICNACGLYLKLHGTHRPNSMKKSIIKRRKRVPAAAGGATSSPSAVTRAAEHAAAETLLAVGRAASLSSRSGSAVNSGASDGGSASDNDASRRKRKRNKDDEGEAPRMTRRASAAAVAARSLLDVSSSSRAPSPQHPRMQSLHPLQTHARHSLGYDSMGRSYSRHGSASPAGGYDLPSIAALSAGMSPRESEAAAMLAERSLSRERHSHMSRVPSMGSDVHSNSAPSSTSQHSGIPTYGELERHYAELRAEKRRLEDMVERTSAMMDRVRVGMEDMTRAQQQQQQQQVVPQPSSHAPSHAPSVEHSPHLAQAVPLRAREAPRATQPVWQWSGPSASNDQEAKP